MGCLFVFGARARTMLVQYSRYLEWAPGVGQFQAADLTGLRSCSSSKGMGLR